MDNRVFAGSDILIKIATEDSSVRFDTYGGFGVMFNHDEFRPKSVLISAKDKVFTGVYFNLLPKEITPIVTDLEGNMLNFTFFKKGLYVGPKERLWLEEGKPIALIKFIPTNPHPVIKDFYANFIKLNKGSL